jgi:Spy/CpxP family protein refolding chaperone
MRRQFTVLAVIGVLAAGAVVAQNAAPKRAAGANPGGVARHRLMKNLNLDAAQKQQAKTIFQGAKESAQPLAQQLRQDRAAMKAAVQAGDSAKIQQLSQEMGGLRGKVMAVRAAAMAKFMTMLTPEQKAKAEQMRDKMQQRFRKNG